jgi:hypothetical protein
MYKLPFGWLPGHWGLAGKTREIAKAEYELEGYELEVKLHELKKDEMELDEWQRKMWDIQVKHNKMSPTEHKRLLVTQIKDDKQRDLASLELDWQEDKITELDYNKKTASLKGEPWVTVINMDFSKGTSLEGSFELDWNEAFVEKLKAEGYSGPSPDVIVNQWFMEVCRNVAMEEFAGVGDFEADSEANLEAMKRWTGKESSQKGKREYR